MSKNIHTVFNKDRTVPEEKWLNKEEGNPVAVSSARTKAEAVKLGREAAMKNKSEHLIHNRNGEIAQKNSYGNDPPEIKG